MKKINVEQWDRKEIFRFYENFSLPRFQMTVNVNIKRYLRYLKKNKVSFYYGMMWLILKVIHEQEAFRYRFVDNEPVLFANVHPSFTEKVGDGSRFKIVHGEYADDLITFEQKLKAAALKQGDQFINEGLEPRQDWLYFSTFPWETFTHATNVTNFDSRDAIPRIGWGKFTKKGELPLTIEVHHAFCDGYHVGLFIHQLKMRLKGY